MKKQKKNNPKLIRLTLFTLVLFIVSLMSVGYARYNEELKEVGIVSFFFDQGEPGLFDMNITGIGVTNGTTGTINSFVKRGDNTSNLTYDLSTTTNFTVGSDRFIEYNIVVTNNTDEDYRYNWLYYRLESSDPNVTFKSPRIVGITKDDKIAAGEMKRAKIILFYEGELDTDVSLDTFFQFTFTTPYHNYQSISLSAAIRDKEFLVEEDELDFNSTIEIINGYDVSIKYSIYSTDERVILVDSNGNPSSYTTILDVDEEIIHDVYFKLTESLEDNSSIYTTIYMELEDGTIREIDRISVTNDPDGPGEDDYEDIGGDNKTEIDSDKVSITYRYTRYDWGQSSPTWGALWIDVENKTNEEICDWTVYAMLDENISIDKAGSWSYVVAYDSKRHAVKWSSKDRHTPNQKVCIPPNQTLSSQELHIAPIPVGVNTDPIKKIEIYNISEDFEPDDMPN